MDGVSMPISLDNLKKERLQLLKQHCDYMLVIYCPSCDRIDHTKTYGFWCDVEDYFYCGRCGTPLKAVWFFIKDGKPALLENQEERGETNVGEKGNVR
jgi:uncharacterized protein YbaR (Trm112 family)